MCFSFPEGTVICAWTFFYFVAKNLNPVVMLGAKISEGITEKI